MASLGALAKSRTRKAELSKLLKTSEKKLREVLSAKRRSSSGLSSLERKKEATVRQKDHIIQLLTQFLAQKDSIARLKTTAEERLRQEQDARDAAKQQSEFGGTESKAASDERIKIIDEKISELRSEIKQREAAEERLLKQIDDLTNQKSKIETQLRKQGQAKPQLVELLKSSEKAEVVLRPRVHALIKRESQATNALKAMIKQVAEAQAKRRNAARKAARKAAARRAKRKARKAKTKRKAAKTKTRTKKAQRRKIKKARPSRKTKRKVVKRKSRTKTARKAKRKAVRRKSKKSRRRAKSRRR